MPDFVTLIAVFLVSRGVVQTFTKDLWWTVVRYQYQMVGLTATRTAAWDRWSTRSGLFWLLCGIAIFIFVPR